jgi:1-deoxy-D-xylulose-5-phosphate reductoisomerase
MQKICLLGATGSIGDSTVKVVEAHSDRLQLTALAAHSNWKRIAELCHKHPTIRWVSMYQAEAAAALRSQIPAGITVLEGQAGLLELAQSADYDILLNGVVGSVGCLPTLAAIERDKPIALANKETLVMAGDVVARALAAHPKSRLLPVDSEHNAIFQCLADRPSSEVSHLILTASGGPFRTWPKEDLLQVTPEQALKHPTWTMGPKITIDSASLMNKGLEVIEAHYLFGVGFDKIQVVVHPGSIVHSLVQFKDGSLMAQLGAPDMRVPIQVSLSWPERWNLEVPHVHLPQLGKLEFYEPDMDRFPCLALAYEAGRRGGIAPAVLNAANEVAVPAFLAGKIPFMGIPKLVERVLSQVPQVQHPSLDDVLGADAEARVLAQDFLQS